MSGSVRAQIKYVEPSPIVNRRFVSHGVEVNTGTYLPHEVDVRDARPLRTEFTLDSAGFALIDHKSAVSDFLDKDEIERVYPDEVATAIKAVTGADLVANLGWMVRTSGDVEKHQEKSEAYVHKGGVQPPAGEAHCDASQDRVDQMAEHVFRERFPDQPGYSRFLYTSFWRTFSPPPQDCPLGLCHGASVGDDEGVPNVMYVVDELPSREEMIAPIEGEENAVAAAIFHFNPKHQWWYFPDMTRDEALLLKFHDSRRQTPWRVPHTAFFIPDREIANVRQSIEVRTIAYFL